MSKVPLTARVSPDLSDKIKLLQEQGKTKTEILESALNLYFENNQENEQITPGLIRSIFRDELLSFFSNISEIQEQSIISFFGKLLSDTPVIQETSDTHVIQETSDTHVIQEINKNLTAKELVNKINEIRIKDSCSIKVACKKAGCSDKKYYNMLRIIKTMEELKR